MTKLDAGLLTPLPASDSGNSAVWGSKSINPRLQSCLRLTWSGYRSNDDDVNYVLKYIGYAFYSERKREIKNIAKTRRILGRTQKIKDGKKIQILNCACLEDSLDNQMLTSD